MIDLIRKEKGVPSSMDEMERLFFATQERSGEFLAVLSPDALCVRLNRPPFDGWHTTVWKKDRP